MLQFISEHVYEMFNLYLVEMALSPPEHHWIFNKCMLFLMGTCYDLLYNKDYHI